MEKQTKEKFIADLENHKKFIDNWLSANPLEEADYLEDLVFTFNRSTVKIISDDIDFVLFLVGQDKYSDKIFYPVRSIFENCLRAMWLSSQTYEKQKEVCKDEILRLQARFYKATNDELFKDNFLAVDGILPIDTYKIGNDLFPSINPMLQELLGSTYHQSDYFLYQGLCEPSHGKYLSRLESDFEAFGFLGIASLYIKNLIEQCLGGNL